jgi:glutamine synthetase
MGSHMDRELSSIVPSREDIQDAIHALGEHDVQLVSLQFSDIAGGARTVTIPVSLLPRVFHRGYRFDGAAMAGGERQVEVDLFLMPDPATLTIFPEQPGKPRGAQLYCWVTRRESQPFAGDPRTILQRQLQRAATMGIDYRAGIELEFYLYTGDSLTDAARAADLVENGYFGDGGDDTAAVRDEIVASLHELGVGVHGAHHETGPGQQELDLRHSGGIRIADQLMTTRQVIRRVARQHGMRATFMAKPFPDLPGSGMHIFQRVLSLDDGEDLLRDEGDAHGMSTMAQHMIAGQLAHAPAMSAILNTTVNSYKRLADGHRAPAWATWARVSRGSLLRVPTAGSEQPTDLELRSPDALANPYLAIAVALGAAIDGIANEMEPPPPFDENLVSYDEDEFHRLGAVRLPQTMGEALDEMATNDVMRSVLGTYIFDQLLSVKRAEWADYRRHVSPWEHARYGDI